MTFKLRPTEREKNIIFDLPIALLCLAHRRKLFVNQGDNNLAYYLSDEASPDLYRSRKGALEQPISLDGAPLLVESLAQVAGARGKGVSLYAFRHATLTVSTASFGEAVSKRIAGHNQQGSTLQERYNHGRLLAHFDDEGAERQPEVGPDSAIAAMILRVPAICFVRRLPADMLTSGRPELDLSFYSPIDYRRLAHFDNEGAEQQPELGLQSAVAAMILPALHEELMAMCFVPEAEARLDYDEEDEDDSM